MPSEFREFSDFPARGLPLRGWTNLSRLMFGLIPVLGVLRRGFTNLGFALRASWRR